MYYAPLFVDLPSFVSSVLLERMLTPRQCWQASAKLNEIAAHTSAQVAHDGQTQGEAQEKEFTDAWKWWA
jgi:hypothetical protein